MSASFRCGLAIACLVGMLWAPPVSAQGVVISSGGTRITKRVRSLQAIRQANLVRQKWDLSCGSAALGTLLTYHLNDPVPETAIIVWILRRSDPVRIQSRGGFSLLDLKRFVQARGYDAEGYADLGLQDLLDLRRPAIVPVRIKGFDHFLVFRGVIGDRVALADPAFGNLTMKTHHFVEVWKNGIGFVVLPKKLARAANDMAPTPKDFLVPDGSVLLRSFASAGLVPPTRRIP